MNIIIRINVYVFINLYKKNFLQITRFNSITFKINIKKYVHYWNRIMNVFSKVLRISRVVANG